jgi:hypothetical protein
VLAEAALAQAALAEPVGAIAEHEAPLAERRVCAAARRTT